MRSEPSFNSTSEIAGLGRDLALVGPFLASPPVPIQSGAAEWAVPLKDVGEIAQAIRRSQAPAIVGLNSLSIEACRHAVAVAEVMRGRLLPWPLPGDNTHDHSSVTQTGSLGHIFASELIIWVGCSGGDGPIAEAIAAHQLLGALVPADLATVLNARRTMAADPKAAPIGSHRRVGVVLGPGIDPRVASQWHKLAAQVQTTTRMAVFALPDLAATGNRRGVLEVILWQTGQSCRTGGVDFADGAPRPCSDAQTQLDLGAIDLLIDTTLPEFPPATGLTGHVKHRIVIGPRVSAGPTAERLRHVTVPPLTQGVAARVMRCDGVILWTCADPAQAQPDSAAAFFQALNLALRSSGNSGGAA